MIKPAYSVSFLLSINIFVCQNVLYFPNNLRVCVCVCIYIYRERETERERERKRLTHQEITSFKLKQLPTSAMSQFKSDNEQVDVKKLTETLCKLKGNSNIFILNC